MIWSTLLFSFLVYLVILEPPSVGRKIQIKISSRTAHEIKPNQEERDEYCVMGGVINIYFIPFLVSGDSLQIFPTKREYALSEHFIILAS